MADESLTLDELQACCWDDPSDAAVLGTADGRAAVAVVVRGDAPAGRTGHIRVLAVDPDQQRRGVGRALLGSAEQWLRERGVGEVRAGGDAPFYLWPGIDVRWTAALAFFETGGYHEAGAVLDLSCPASFRAPAPAGVTVRRALDDADAHAVVALVGREWPWWADEVGRAIDHGSCLVAVDDAGEVIAFGCHSVNRGGWIGPLGTAPERGRCGVGAAILGELCSDLAVAGYRRAEIAWIGPVAFYAKVADAHVSRVFQTRVRRLR